MYRFLRGTYGWFIRTFLGSVYCYFMGHAPHYVAPDIRCMTCGVIINTWHNIFDKRNVLRENRFAEQCAKAQARKEAQ